MSTQTSIVFVGTAASAQVAVLTKANIAAHFRRHTDWKDYMTAVNDIAEMEYGFDWLGDEKYDFDQIPSTQPPNHIVENRYEYIEKHPYNLSIDMSVPDSIETLSTDMCEIEKELTWTLRNIPRNTTTTRGTAVTTTHSDGNSRETTTETERTVGSPVNRRLPNQTTKIDGIKNINANILTLKNAYQHGGGLLIIGGNKYFPAYLNVRFNKSVKLIFGINHLDAAPGINFGDNNDEIHLIPRAGSENKFSITPNKISKSDLATGSVEITIKNITTSIVTTTSILAYHIDDNTPKDAGNKPIIVANANRVGELIILPNKKYYSTECVLIKVKRANVAATASTAASSTDFTSGTNNYGNYDKDKIEKCLKRILAQANIEVNIVEKDLNNFTGPDVTTSDNSFCEAALNAYCKQEIPATTRGAARIRAITNLKNSKKLFIFLHDYVMNPRATGPGTVAFALTEKYRAARQPTSDGEANTVMIFSNADEGSIVHECVHSMGCHHTFIAQEALADFGGTLGIKNAVYFRQREKDQKHLFHKGKTENLMDYNYGYRYKGNVSAMDDVSPPFLAVSKTYYTATLETKYRCYEADTNTYSNPNPKLCATYKWQWDIIQRDDELIAKSEPV